MGALSFVGYVVIVTLIRFQIGILSIKSLNHFRNNFSWHYDWESAKSIVNVETEVSSALFECFWVVLLNERCQTCPQFNPMHLIFGAASISSPYKMAN